MEDVYEGLITHKIGEESFSEEIRRLLNEKKPKKLADCLGLWKYMGKEEIDSIEEAIKQRRAYTTKMREAKFQEPKR